MENPNELLEYLFQTKDIVDNVVLPHGPSRLMRNSIQYINETQTKTKEYLKSNPLQIKSLFDSIRALKFIKEIIPNGSPDGLIYREAETEVECAVFLTIQGCYKQSMIALRNALELFLLYALYSETEREGNLEMMEIFEKHLRGELTADEQYQEIIKIYIKPNGKVDIREWLNSMNETEKPYKVRNFIKKSEIFQNLRPLKFHDNINDLYSDLCDYTHSNGMKYWSFNFKNPTNAFAFDGKKMEAFLISLRDVIRVICALLLSMFSNAIGESPLVDEEFEFPYLPPGYIPFIQCLFTDDENSVLFPASKNSDNFGD